MRPWTPNIGVLIIVFLISACLPLSTPTQATAPETQPTSLVPLRMDPLYSSALVRVAL